MSEHGLSVANPIRQTDDPRRLGIKAMRKLARRHGGQCLSEIYVNVFRKLVWQCGAGHIWESPPNSVLRGRWCPQCRKERFIQEHMEKLRAAAKAKGGECLSSEYTDHRARLTWRCAKGHIWQARSDAILGKGWCPVCRYEKSKRSLADLQALAEKRGGLCLATEYVSMNHKVLWQCAQGHIWEATGNRIQVGHWCLACAHDGMRLNIELMREIAQSRGGFCLSEKYVDSGTKLTWQCRYGHVWEAAPGSIRAGSWCPVCARRAPHNIDGMQKLAQERGGHCLSGEYHGTAHKLSWQCKLGHVWETTPFTVLKGSWCPECYWLSMCLSDEARKKYLPTLELPKNA
ncbi:MAG: hypothetical protein FWG81_01240 [Betaproteobacteria bacterium]|nr:hypothetical protein [Betaproteobacteria bacterium]